MHPKARTCLVLALFPLGAACSLLSASCSHNIRRSVEGKLNADWRNRSYSLDAYCKHPDTLILDLSRVSSASPVDLFRGVFQASEALYEGVDINFDKVILARQGKPIFFIEGGDFSTLGAEFKNGQNPIYLIRTLPEKLYLPGGESAFPRWEGGWLGVFSKQMEDANQAARQWSQ